MPAAPRTKKAQDILNKILGVPDSMKGKRQKPSTTKPPMAWWSPDGYRGVNKF